MIGGALARAPRAGVQEGEPRYTGSPGGTGSFLVRQMILLIVDVSHKARQKLKIPLRIDSRDTESGAVFFEFLFAVASVGWSSF